MELFNGLPHRTIHIETEDKDIIFGISTEEVGKLITHESNIKFEWINHFDNATAYFVPEHVFLNEFDETVINYIKANIDDQII